MRKTATLLVVVLAISASIAYATDIPRTLYVMNGLARTLSKLNLETGEITNDIVVLGDIPNQVVTFRDRVYVVNSTPPEILVINPQNERVEKRIALAEGSNPWFMAFVGRNRAYVTNLLANTVSVVDLEAGAVVKDIPVGVGPQGILVVENTAFVANTGGWPDYAASSVTIIDALADTVTMTLPMPPNAQDLALGPDGRIYVVCSGAWGANAGKVCVIDRWAGPGWTPAVVDTLDIGGWPGDIVVTAGGKAYLCDWGDDNNGFLYSYDVYTDSVYHDSTNPIRVGKGAMRLIYDGRENVIYVSNFSDDTVQKYSPEGDSVLATYGFGDGAQDMAILEPIYESDPWADAVVSFTPGDPWSGFGYNYFPDNVLGPPDPDPTINEYNPSNNPQEILSLGHGGEIVLEFTDNKIVDGEGPDFTVFENAFYYFGTVEPFIEAAIVSVSQDGINFVTFPYDTTTMSGLAGVTPTMDNLHPTDPEVSGGDHFDLADVGLPWARFVKLTDLGDLYQEGPWSGDFDLDAVVAIHSEPISFVADNIKPGGPTSFTLEQNYPNPFNSSTCIRYRLDDRGEVELKIFDVLGREVRTLVRGVQEPGEHLLRWDGTDDRGQSVPSGLYFYRLKSREEAVRKMLLIR